MLYQKAVEPGTLELLKKLCQIQELKNFVLIGGTNLALRFGHRMSVDLEFFCTEKFSETELEQTIYSNFKNFQISHSDYQTRQYFIDNIKVEFIGFRYPLLNDFETIENIRLFSMEDSIAAKLNAIMGRGSKKDFYDISEILKKYSLPEILNYFKSKFNQENIFPLLKSLNYFDDADEEPDPVSLTNITWKEVKENINRKLLEYYGRKG